MTAVECNPSENSDSALMLSYSTGDFDGFELLYERHKNSVFRFFYFGTGGDELLASELFQDVWMTVVRGRHRYHRDISFTEWLRHVAWARLYDHIRLHPQCGEYEPATAVVQENLPGNVVSLHPVKASATDSQLLMQLRGMSDEHREIVLLRYCFRMSFSDIAEFLDIARSSVSLLHREALKNLRQTQCEPVNG